MKTRFTSTLLAVLTVLLIFSCASKKAQKNSKYISSYVYAYTSGAIAQAAPVRVRFANPVTSPDQVGKAIPNGVFSVSPSLKGTAIWEDTETLLFKPEEGMANGKNYVGEVRLDRLFQSVPSEAISFQFDFRAKKQFFDIIVEGVQTPEINNFSNMQLQGYVTTADIADDKSVESILAARQNNDKLSIGWIHSNDHKKHSFWVNQIQRTENQGSVELSWDGRMIQVDKKGSEYYEIPALKDFKVMNVKVIDNEDKQVVVNFSDPIEPNQDLTGLIRFDQIQASSIIVDRNMVRMYANSPYAGGLKVFVEAGIKNTKGKAFEKQYNQPIYFGDTKPQVKLCGHGSIIPTSENGLLFPFEAVNLNAVDVEIFKIFDNNVMQFLQTSDIDNQYDYGLNRVGRVILQKKVALNELNSMSNKGHLVRYNLDISKLVKADPAAVYQVRIGFKADYATYECEQLKENKMANMNQTQSEEEVKLDENGDPVSLFGYNYDYYDENGAYVGDQAQNPCSKNYYKSQYIQRNILASNIGVILKMGNDKSCFVAVTDLRSAQPLPNAEVEFLDFQNQKMTQNKTNSEGICKVQLERKPALCLVNINKEFGYIKIQDGSALNLSRFSVAGDMAQKGIKGFIYGERGVWRPGDSIFLNFVLENRDRTLPPNHPITFELKDPNGQIQQRFTTVSNVNNIYNLTTFTRAEAPTGSYHASVKVGGAVFQKEIKIETVKPNRLKVKLDFGKEQLSAADGNLTGTLQSNWLTGPSANGLKAKVEVQFSSIKTDFEKYPDYVFDDPARNFNGEPQTIFDNNLDANGQAQVPLKYNFGSKSSGKLKANFKVRVFERGGDFSTDNFSMIYHLYEIYVGIAMPKNKEEQKEINTNEDGKIRLVAVDKYGNPARNVNLNVGLYKVDWRWWWDASANEVSSFNSDAHVGSVKNQILKTNDKGEVVWNVNISEWGRYFVRVINPEGGHASGDFFNVGTPWGEEGSQSNRVAESLLPFKANKEKFAVGEKVTLDIPSAQVGRFLVTIENGSKVLQHYWADAKRGNNDFTFKATAEMTPTVYAHVMMIQPHGQTKNDLPMRQYGVIPINVENKEARLEPWLNMPETLEPEKTFTVDIGEKSSKAMTYTLAVVDEGLLDLTRFQTPDPYSAFNTREALGVKTWDVYDQVLSAAFGVEMDRVLNIGGDGVVKAGEGNRANRFKPVVQHLGPFYLAPGRKAHHQIKLPNYIGSVKVMLVAAENGAYGNAERKAVVRKPLMLLATLPRVLSPGETLKLPVDIFAMEKKVSNVNITVQESSGLIAVQGGTTKSLYFSAPGEKQTAFDIKVNEGEGVARFKILAEGGGEKIWQDIEIQVRNPNPRVTNVLEKTLSAGEASEFNFQPAGTMGTNEGILEISTIPPINLGQRLPYLLEYPHGCVEQTTSAAFPQLYVAKFLELTDNQKNIAYNNVKAGLESLQRFQTDNGGFGYWAGQREVNDWGTSYVGQFLIEAQKNGFTLPLNMLEKWKTYQQGVAKRWEARPKNNAANNYYYEEGSDHLSQAYRLYTLAAAGAPELGAMNRLREIKDLSNAARWRLAAAYALAGKSEEAKNLTQKSTTTVNKYTELSDTYGSDLRDEAQIMETLLLLGDKNRAGEIAKSISQKMSSQSWYSTQSVAQSLLSMAKLLGENSVQNGFSYSYKMNQNNIVNANCKTALAQIVVPIDKGTRKVSVKNTSKGILFARLILSGKPVIGDPTTTANNLAMKVLYKNMKGENLSPSSIAQGTDFFAEVTVTNPGSLGKNYKEMALSQVFPSGWEIHNARMQNISYGASALCDYQDIRDDRVYTYFSIGKGQSVTYRIQLHAAYIGKYYLPTTLCEAMYDNSITARNAGQWVTVNASEGSVL